MAPQQNRQSETHPAVYLFLGPEEGEKLAAINEIREALRSRAGDIEEHSYYAFDTPAETVVGLLLNGTLFGGAVFVRYRSIEQLKKKTELEALIRYVASPNQQSVLILESLEYDRAISSDLKKAVGPKQKRIFWEMFEDQKQAWLAGYLRRRKATIDAAALDLLLEMVENNTLDLRAETDKLIAYAGQRISLTDVERFVYHARQENVFTLFDAIVEGKLDHALDVAEKILVQGDATGLIAGLSWQIDRLLMYREIRSRESDDRRAFSELERLLSTRSGKPPELKKPIRRSLQAAAQRYSLGQCRAIALLTGEIEALLRSVAGELHKGLIQQYLYSVISRGGAWTPKRQTAWPWHYSRYSP